MKRIPKNIESGLAIASDIPIHPGDVVTRDIYPVIWVFIGLTCIANRDWLAIIAGITMLSYI